MVSAWQVLCRQNSFFLLFRYRVLGASTSASFPSEADTDSYSHSLCSAILLAKASSSTSTLLNFSLELPPVSFRKMVVFLGAISSCSSLALGKKSEPNMSAVAVKGGGFLTGIVALIVSIGGYCLQSSREQQSWLAGGVQRRVSMPRVWVYCCSCWRRLRQAERQGSCMKEGLGWGKQGEVGRREGCGCEGSSREQLRVKLRFVRVVNGLRAVILIDISMTFHFQPQQQHSNSHELFSEAQTYCAGGRGPLPLPQRPLPHHAGTPQDAQTHHHPHRRGRRQDRQDQGEGRQTAPRRLQPHHLPLRAGPLPRAARTAPSAVEPFAVQNRDDDARGGQLDGGAAEQFDKPVLEVPLAGAHGGTHAVGGAEPAPAQLAVGTEEHPEGEAGERAAEAEAGGDCHDGRLRAAHHQAAQGQGGTHLCPRAGPTRQPPPAAADQRTQGADRPAGVGDQRAARTGAGHHGGEGRAHREDQEPDRRLPTDHRAVRGGERAGEQGARGHEGQDPRTGEPAQAGTVAQTAGADGAAGAERGGEAGVGRVGGAGAGAGAAARGGVHRVRAGDAGDHQQEGRVHRAAQPDDRVPEAAQARPREQFRHHRRPPLQLISIIHEQIFRSSSQRRRSRSLTEGFMLRQADRKSYSQIVIFSWGVPLSYSLIVRSAAAMTALEVSPQKSAPVKFAGTCWSTLSQSRWGARLRCLVWALSILSLSAGLVVIPRQICLSNLPGLRMEGSRRSGRLVAPITKTCWAGAASIWRRSSATMRSMTWWESPPLPRLGMRASSSSMKTMQGRQAAARWKTCRTFFSLSPTYMFSSSGPFTLRKLIPHSRAMHFPSRVFPVPGGPQNSRPVRGVIHSSKISGWRIGSSTVCTISSFAASRPPTSSQLTAVRLAAYSCFTRVFRASVAADCCFFSLPQLAVRKVSSFSQPNLSWNSWALASASEGANWKDASTLEKMLSLVCLESQNLMNLAYRNISTVTV